MQDSAPLKALSVHRFSCCRATREALGGFEAKAETQELRIEVLAGRVEDLERRLADRDAPLLLRIARGFWRFLFGRGKTRCAEAVLWNARLPVSVGAPVPLHPMNNTLLEQGCIAC